MMSSGRKSTLKGFRLDKNGKLQKDTRRLSVSKQIAQRKSKKISVKRTNPRGT